MRLAVYLAAIATLAACGGTTVSSTPSAMAQREWSSNIAIVIRELRADVATTQLAGATRASARAALRNESDVYALLVAYTDLAGCRSIVFAAGAAPRAAEPVNRFLASACTHLERSSTLFTRAVRTGAGLALLRAAGEADRALPALVRAAAALERVRAS